MTSSPGEAIATFLMACPAGLSLWAGDSAMPIYTAGLHYRPGLRSGEALTPHIVPTLRLELTAQTFTSSLRRPIRRDAHGCAERARLPPARERC